jgi:predicted nucleotide-binding protein (sugar kinase/HSP70/actin superfamily)
MRYNNECEAVRYNVSLNNEFNEREKTTMTRHEFIELKDRFYRVAEAISLYDSGNHPEYDKDTLDADLNAVHAELCYQASLLAQKLIRALDNGQQVDLEEKHFLNELFIWCDNCRCYSDCSEMLDLTQDYGSGYVDPIGADFEVFENNTEYKFFGYREFYDLLESYTLVEA